MAANLNLSLIIVDSIAGPLRSEFEAEFKRERATMIHKMGYLLNNISRTLNIPILITNQVRRIKKMKIMFLIFYSKIRKLSVMIERPLHAALMIEMMLCAAVMTTKVLKIKSVLK
jgi:translation initiation factor 2 gamma subunit (eIF-2gamma)